MRLLFSIFLILFTHFVSTNVASAEETRPLIANVGRGVFNLTSPTINCRKLIRSFRRLPAWHVAAIYNTFGNDFRCWDKLVVNKKFQTIELNLINEPGHRNKRLGSYEFLYSIGSPSEYNTLLKKQDPKLKAKFVKYVQLAKKKISQLPPQVACIINPGLESNVSSDAGKVLVKWAKEQFPQCRIVWNPLSASTVKQSSYADADLIEGHGNLPPVSPACLVNLDGTDVDFPERKSKLPKGSYVESGRPLTQYIHSYANKCEIVFIWTAEDNCNYSSTFIDPRKRNCNKAAAIYELVAREAEVAMKTIRVYKPFPWTAEERKSEVTCNKFDNPTDGSKRGFLIKQSEFRSRGGVIILPATIKNSRKVEILHKGKVIDSYTRNGAYEHDGSRRPLWRSGDSPVNYPYHVVVRVKDGDRNLCYKIANPKERVD